MREKKTEWVQLTQTKSKEEHEYQEEQKNKEKNKKIKKVPWIVAKEKRNMVVFSFN